MKNQPHQPERRRYIRIKKNFILSYYAKSEPAVRYKVSQMKNIGKGGMCFITSQKYLPDTPLIIELRTPYLADVTQLEGIVLESHEKIPDIIYETRLRFDNLSPQAIFLLDRLEEFFKKGEHNNHE